jgi:hypothetical protein
MSGSLNANTGSQATPPTQNQQLMNMLMNPNAYKYAAGLLMAVWGNVASEEMKVNMENAQMNAQAISMQSSAVGMEAGASVLGGAVSAASSGMEAASDFVQVGLYAKNASDTSAANKALTAAKANAPAAVANAVIEPKDTANQAAVNDAQAKVDALQNDKQHIQSIGQANTALAKAAGALGQGFTQAAGQLAGNGASMFTQVEQELAANQSAANQTLQGVLQNMGSIGQIALAGARG